MSNLYQVRKEVERVLYEELDLETGEISAEGVLLLDALEIDQEELALQRARFCKELRARAEAVLTVVRERREQYEKLLARAEKIELALAKELEPGTRFHDEFAEIIWRKSSAVDVVDQTLIPDEFMVQPPTPLKRPDKVALKKALGQGPVAGAQLVKRHALKVK